MEVILIETTAYYKLREETFSFFAQKIADLEAKIQAINNPIEDWVSPSTARTMLRIGKTKYHELKNAGVLQYTQHGRKVSISKKSVFDFMKKNSTL
jgi:hypothetical protein